MFERILNTKPGWYRGEFHSHTHFSDGVLSPQELVTLAKNEGLDFLAVTDHNSIGAFPELGDLDELLIIPGAEITLDVGHFNVFGLKSQHPWMQRLFDKAGGFKAADLPGTVSELGEQIKASGFISSVNHPLLEPWEWQVGDLDLALIQCLEIWNDPSWPDNQFANPNAVEMWTDWLNDGYRIAGIGGSDFHRPTPGPGQNKPSERLGLPRTYCYSENLSVAAILKSLQERKVYVSMGPEVSFQVELAGQTFGIGDELGKISGEIKFSGTVRPSEGNASARIVKNGQIIYEHQGTSDPFQIDYRDQSDPNRSTWYRLEVTGPAGEYLVITNPIFTGPKPAPGKRFYGDFLRV